MMENGGYHVNEVQLGTYMMENGGCHVNEV